MFGDIYSTKYMGKITDTFGRMKFRLPQNISGSVKPKLISASSRESKIKLLMLVSDFMVNSRLKSTQWHFNGIHGMS